MEVDKGRRELEALLKIANAPSLSPRSVSALPRLFMHIGRSESQPCSPSVSAWR